MPSTSACTSPGGRVTHSQPEGARALVGLPEAEHDQTAIGMTGDLHASDGRAFVAEPRAGHRDCQLLRHDLQVLLLAL